MKDSRDRAAMPTLNIIGRLSMGKGRGMGRVMLVVYDSLGGVVQHRRCTRKGIELCGERGIEEYDSRMSKWRREAPGEYSASWAPVFGASYLELNLENGRAVKSLRG
jgi:hypothetical protein